MLRPLTFSRNFCKICICTLLDIYERLTRCKYNIRNIFFYLYALFCEKKDIYTYVTIQLNEWLIFITWSHREIDSRQRDNSSRRCLCVPTISPWPYEAPFSTVEIAHETGMSKRRVFWNCPWIILWTLRTELLSSSNRAHPYGRVTRRRNCGAPCLFCYFGQGQHCTDYQERIKYILSFYISRKIWRRIGEQDIKLNAGLSHSYSQSLWSKNLIWFLILFFWYKDRYTIVKY